MKREYSCCALKKVCTLKKNDTYIFVRKTYKFVYILTMKKQNRKVKFGASSLLVFKLCIGLLTLAHIQQKN
jgi:hypothetical protein